VLEILSGSSTNSGEWRNGRRAWLRTTWGNSCRFKSCLAHHPPPQLFPASSRVAVTKLGGVHKEDDPLPSRRVLLTRRKETVPLHYRLLAGKL
jgi:hypothetical protein